jgi:RNA polymerase sigma-70 factor (ECF subfamily)
MPTRTADDSDTDRLLHRAQGGECLALGQLLERFRGYLMLLAGLQIDRRLRGKVDAADLVQETFLEAHRDFAQFRGTTAAELAGWLRQILAANVAGQVRRYLRTRGRDVRMERRLAAELEESSQLLDRGFAAPQSTPSQQAAEREQALRLADALQQLPESYRDVIILRQLEGLTFAEVARRMERTVDSVKNLWARALARLSRAVGDGP